jgi:hypothetical protein
MLFISKPARTSDFSVMLPSFSVDFGMSSKGTWMISVTDGLLGGISFAHYCTNTSTNPVSDASFKPPEQSCGCSTGP